MGLENWGELNRPLHGDQESAGVGAKLVREAPPDRAAKRRQSSGPGVSPGSTSPGEASAGGAKDSQFLSPRLGDRV